MSRLCIWALALELRGTLRASPYFEYSSVGLSRSS
jgi:hypothetical protein